jgi:ATP sulfurylase
MTTGQPQEASSKRHWGYPALVELQNAQCYALYSEADINPYQSASSLKSSGNTSYQIYQDRNPLHLDGNWHTP